MTRYQRNKEVSQYWREKVEGERSERLARVFKNEYLLARLESDKNWLGAMAKHGAVKPGTLVVDTDGYLHKVREWFNA